MEVADKTVWPVTCIKFPFGPGSGTYRSSPYVGMLLFVKDDSRTSETAFPEARSQHLGKVSKHSHSMLRASPARASDNTAPCLQRWHPQKKDIRRQMYTSASYTIRRSSIFLCSRLREWPAGTAHAVHRSGWSCCVLKAALWAIKSKNCFYLFLSKPAGNSEWWTIDAWTARRLLFP